MYALEQFRKGKFWEKPQGPVSLLERVAPWQNVPAFDIQNVYDFIYSQELRDRSPTFFFQKENYPCAYPPWERSLNTFRTRNGDEFVVAAAAITLEQAQLVVKARQLPGWDRWENVLKPESAIALTISLLVNGRMVFLGNMMIPVRDRDAIGMEGIFEATPEGLDLFPDPTGEDRTAYLLPCVLSVVSWSFANCKNTRQVKASPVSRQQRRAAERKGEPVFEHHVLEIGGLTNLLHTEGKLGEHGDLHKAMHICRGHFSRYGEKYGTGKLFGKHEGMFWVPQHTRGSLEAGLITKDYVMRASA